MSLVFERVWVWVQIIMCVEVSVCECVCVCVAVVKKNTCSAHHLDPDFTPLWTVVEHFVQRITWTLVSPHYGLGLNILFSASLGP